MLFVNALPRGSADIYDDHYDRQMTEKEVIFLRIARIKRIRRNRIKVRLGFAKLRRMIREPRRWIASRPMPTPQFANRIPHE